MDDSLQRPTRRGLSRVLSGATVMVAVTVAMPNACHALVSFGAARPLTANSKVDQDQLAFPFDDAPAAAADGLGNWVAIWGSRDRLGGLLTGSENVIVTRSTDDGRTWSSPEPLLASGLTEGQGGYDIATDSAGVWVAVTLDGRISRSTDVGQTWTLVHTSSLYSGLGGSPDVETDGEGNWVAVWTSLSGDNFKLFWSRSGDDGLTWSPAARVDPSVSGIFNFAQGSPTVVAGSGSDWWVLWSPDSGLRMAKSTDEAATFAPSTAIDVGNSATTSLGRLDALRSSTGTWIITWGAWTGLVGRFSLRVSRSTDDGLSWTPFEEVAAGSFPILARDINDTVHIFFSTDDPLGGAIDRDWDLNQIHSLDWGQTWSDAVALTGSARFDREFTAADVFSRYGVVTSDGAGRWGAFWQSK